MPVILQLDPPVPVHTPKGKGFAHLVIEYGQEHHLYWTVAIAATGEIWTFKNPLVRAQANVSLGTSATGIDEDGRVIIP